MSVEVTLEYQRNGTRMTSRGRLVSNENGLITEEGTFDDLPFKDMMKALATVLRNWELDSTPHIDVIIQRTDRAGLLPYRLDKQTTDLLRTDPVAGIEALSFEGSPTAAVQQLAADRTPPAPITLKTGAATIADAFGDSVAFRVRGHELECPGCGFWGVFTTPGLLNDPERAGEVFKTVFVCPKKCGERFVVSCHKEWGFVQVEYLLQQTKLDAFYFPRAWNGGRPWANRTDLQKMYDEYKAEKEKVQ